MAGEEITALEALGQTWWEALAELREVISTSESAANRIAACKVVLDYTGKLYTGLAEPFLPEPHVFEEESESEEQ